MGISPRKTLDQNILQICASTQNVFYNNKVPWIFVEQFQRSCTDKTVSVVQFIMARFLSSNRDIIPRKNLFKISCEHENIHCMFFITTKFHEILLSGFRGVALTRKKQDWRTDWRTDGWIKNIPSELVSWGFIKPNSRW